MAAEQRVARWYFGGCASAGAACCTHPLDLLKVHLQTQQTARRGVLSGVVTLVKHEGLLALYSGLTASILRQLTYSTTRFAVYEVAKQKLCPSGGQLPFYQKVMIAATGGACGGFIGTPADMVNVRMQNDVKLAAGERRCYRHALDGLWRVAREEGWRRLFSGASSATARATLMTVGQLSFYDQVKYYLLTTGLFGDNVTTHFLSSLTAGAIATTMTQPMDVIKTRTMNAKPGEFTGVWHIVRYTAKLGPMGFFKGYVPAFVRLGPQTVLTFILLEQLRLNFGFIPQQHH